MSRARTVADPAERRMEVQRAIKRLEEARDALVRAGAPKTLARVRLALSSAKGAERAARGRIYRVRP